MFSGAIERDQWHEMDYCSYFILTLSMCLPDGLLQ